MNFEGKVAVVMGAGKGLGQTLVRRFAEAGADVAFFARSQNSIDLCEAAGRESGRRLLGVRGDVANLDEVRGMAERVLGEFGRVDVLVNMAFGAIRRHDVLSLSDEELDQWRKVVEGGAYGTLLGCRFFAPDMVARGSGAIVNLTSMSSRVGHHGRSEYSAGKVAVHRLSNALAGELGPKGVRVNCVAPGAIWSETLERYYRHLAQETDQTYEEVLAKNVNDMALRRIVTNDEVANAVLFMASDLASGITGAVIDVNAGQLLAP